MKVTEIEKGKHYKIRRMASGDKWPEDWAKACGLTEGKVSHLAFTDGSFIAENCEVRFAPMPAPPSRVMIQKWADNLPNRTVITVFWEWLEKESGYIADAGMNMEKVLDKYHEINRTQLDEERQALLDQARQAS